MGNLNQNIFFCLKIFMRIEKRFGKEHFDRIG